MLRSGTTAGAVHPRKQIANGVPLRHAPDWRMPGETAVIFGGSARACCVAGRRLRSGVSFWNRSVRCPDVEASAAQIIGPSIAFAPTNQLLDLASAFPENRMTLLGADLESPAQAAREPVGQDSERGPGHDAQDLDDGVMRPAVTRGFEKLGCFEPDRDFRSLGRGPGRAVSDGPGTTCRTGEGRQGSVRCRDQPPKDAAGFRSAPG